MPAQPQAQPKAKSVMRLNATLPPRLAAHVGAVTGEGGLYETPSEFIRDLIRRHMAGDMNGLVVDDEETWLEAERDEITAEIKAVIEENDYAPLTKEDFARWRRIARGEE